MAYRVDLGSLRPAQRLPDGRVRVDAHITRAGVFPYMNPDGSIRYELRDDSEVFAPESVSSFEQLPVTNQHPYEPVTAKNARQYMVGANGESVVRDDDHLRTQIMVADEATIAEMETGKKAQVSCGYTCDYDPTPGEHPRYGRYDGRQTNIRGNHIALVTNARAGATARVGRMDAADLEVARRADYAAMVSTDAKLTSIVNGHQHSLDPKWGWCETSHAVSAGAEHGHTHAWVRNADGTITIAMNDGHTHTVNGLVAELDAPGRTDDSRGTPVQRITPRATEERMTTPQQTKNDALDQATKLLADEKLRGDGLQIRLDGVTTDLAAAVARADAAEGALVAAREKIAELEAGRLDHAKLEEANGKVSLLTKQVGELQVKFDEANDPKRIETAAKKRAKIVSVVSAVCGEKFNCDGLADQDLMIEVIGRLGKAVDKDQSPAHIEARFDERVANFFATENAIADVRRATVIANGQQPQKRTDTADDARREMEERNRNGWRPQH